MIRLHEKDINTPEWFDHVWRVEKVHRYDAVRLREFLKDVQTGDRVLDVGAGWWGFAQYAVQHGYPGYYTAIDFSEEARRRTLEITPDLDYRIGNALALPWADGAFDLVGSGELIEHVERPADLVAEMARVCRVGGHLMISTLDPQCDAAKTHGDYPEHLWEFEQGDLEALFSAHGPTRIWKCGHYWMARTRKTT